MPMVPDDTLAALMAASAAAPMAASMAASIAASMAASFALAGGMVYVPPSVTVSVESSCPHSFRTGRLSRLGRWFREVGYTSPILSNDRAFDERWTIETAARGFGEALARDRDARAAIEALGALGCSGPSLGRGRLLVCLGRQPRGQARDAAHQQAVREQLVALEAVLGRICRHRSYEREGGGGRLATALVIMGLALAAGITGLGLGSHELVDGELSRLGLRSLLASGPATVVWILALGILLAGRSGSHRELGLLVLASVIALPALGLGGAVQINRTLDDGSATVHRVAVLELQERRGEGKARSHFAIVEGWHPERGPTQRLRVSSETAARIVPGTSWLRLTTSPGGLGAERLLDLQVEAPATGP